MEDNAGRGKGVDLQYETDVPGNALAFTIIVCSQNDIAAFGRGFEFSNGLFFDRQFFVGGLPVLVDAHGIKFGIQCTDMPHRGYDFIAVAKIALNLGTFCGRFHNDKLHLILCLVDQGESTF